MCERNRIVAYYERGDEIQRLSSIHRNLREDGIKENSVHSGERLVRRYQIQSQ